jgi:hypothetical protein
LEFLAAVLRIYSVIFHLVLSSFLLALPAVCFVQHKPFNLDLLPFDYPDMTRGAVIIGGVGLACTLLSLTRPFKFVFVIWTFAAVYLMLKWFFLSPDSSIPITEQHGAALLTFGAIGAFFGAAWGARMRRRLGLL